MLSELRLLRPGDEALLMAFLEPRLDSSLFLVSNVERAGLVDRGEPFQATYAAHLENGAITAVAAHGWNGVVLLQGDRGLEDAARRAIAESGREVSGLMGPLALVRRIRAALGFAERPARLEDPELLFTVELSKLVVPPLLDRAGIELRQPTDAEVAQPLASFRARYMVEVLHHQPAPDLEDKARRQVEGWHRGGGLWILLDQGQIVSMTGCTARARGLVMVAGVWTPHELRGRGYAKAAVAGSLLRARESGATGSVLFTGETNHAAQRAYRALGYELSGDWGFVLFA